jgi:hypothetical protein
MWMRVLRAMKFFLVFASLAILPSTASAAGGAQCDLQWSQVKNTRDVSKLQKFLVACSSNSNSNTAKSQIKLIIGRSLTKTHKLKAPIKSNIRIEKTPTISNFVGNFSGSPIKIFPYDDWAGQSNDVLAKRVATFLKLTNFKRNPTLSTDKIGVAWYGFDTVAALETKKIVVGFPVFSVTWNGAIWRFETKKNMDIFSADPHKYEPQYGGLCAYCLAIDHVAVSINVFEIYDGKIYLFIGVDERNNWLDIPSVYIKKSDSKWRSVKISDIPETMQRDFDKLVYSEMSKL